MSLFRVSALLIMCVICLSAVGKPRAPQNSETKHAEPDDIAKSIAESASGTLQFAEGNFIGLAKAMAEDKYSFIPKVGKFDGVRSFGEQARHVACAQFAFFNEFEGKKPPEDCENGGHDPAKTKTELVKYLKGSFDDPNRILATAAKNALDPIVIAPTAAHNAKPAVLSSRTVSTAALWWMWHSMDFSILVISWFLVSRLLAGHSLREAAAAASQPSMAYQRGQFWIRRFQKQATTLCAALASF